MAADTPGGSGGTDRGQNERSDGVRASERTTGAPDSSPAHRDSENSPRDRARRLRAAALGRYEGSWAEDIASQLKALHVVDWTTIFGAELLWSALPFIILLSSLANERVDDDLSRHIGLDSQSARIVRGLFRSAPTHAILPLVTGLLFTLAGVVSVVASLEVLYERVFDQPQRGWRDLPRDFAYVAILLGVLIAEASISGAVHRAAGPVVQALLSFVIVALFFAWTMHFLLDGRVRWRRLIRPALVTSLFWLGLSFFSSAYFSSVVVDDSHTYGSIGVVFTLLTWFILVGTTIVLGAVFGAAWQQRVERHGPGDGRGGRGRA